MYEFSAQLNEMSGKMIGRKPLFVAVAQRKEDRKAQLQVIFLHTYLNGYIGNIVHFDVQLGLA